MTVERIPCLKLNVPGLFADPAFAAWLNAGAAKEVRRFPGHVKAENLATWHRPGAEPGEFSDVFVTYDNGEGSDGGGNATGYPAGEGMPAPCWDKLCALVERVLPADRLGRRYAVLWLTNLDDDDALANAP